ncbi:MAG: hypothetical protein LBB48_06530 [Treponema sp.]|nr:hypothetical protein [Treponema sp.]
MAWFMIRLRFDYHVIDGYGIQSHKAGISAATVKGRESRGRASPKAGLWRLMSRRQGSWSPHVSFDECVPANKGTVDFLA